MEELLLWIVIGVASGVGTAAVAWWRLRGSHSWPATEGTVEGHSLREGEYTHAAEISYSYSVEGQFHSGFHQKQFVRESKAEEYLRRFPRGTRVPVRYHPSNHQRSALDTSDIRWRAAGLGEVR